MAAKYWIKLYHEILEDSKMGRLPDNLWRRAIELFLMAGELDSQGQLPCTGDIAWRLRQSEEGLEAELHQLAGAGILTKNADGWLVANFAKRQAPTETVDRVRQFRKRQRKQSAPPVNKDKEVTGIDSVGYANVTKSYTDTDTDTDTETSTKVEGVKPSALHKKQTFLALSELCHIDLKVAPPKQIGQLDQAGEALCKSIADVDLFKLKFNIYWTKIDWRGKQGQTPTPAQIREVYGDYCHWLESGEGIPVYAQKASNNGHHGPSQNNPRPDSAIESGGLSETSKALAAAWQSKRRGSRSPP